jgi:hypothetical protein
MVRGCKEEQRLLYGVEMQDGKFTGWQGGHGGGGLYQCEILPA